jgi:hypothetical protein
VSLKSRVAAFEKLQEKASRRSARDDITAAIEQLGGGVYEAQWVREQYGIVDPASEEIEKTFGIDQIDEVPKTMDEGSCLQNGRSPGWQSG